MWTFWKVSRREVGMAWGLEREGDKQSGQSRGGGQSRICAHGNCGHLFSSSFTVSVLLNSSPETLRSSGCHLNNLVGLSVCLPDYSLKNPFWFQRGQGKGRLFGNQARYFLFLPEPLPKAWDPSFLMIPTPDNIDSVTLFSISRWIFLSFFLFN